MVPGLAIQVGQTSNATIVRPGGQPQPSASTWTLPPDTRTVSFDVQRIVDGQAVTGTLTVVDSCGEWPAFVGGGA